MLAALAQSKASGEATMSVLLWVGVLIGVLLIAAVVLGVLYKKLLGKPHNTPGDASLMDSLRSAYDSGQMSKEEFEAAKRAMTRKAVDAMDAAKAAKSAGASKGSRETGSKQA